MSSLGPAELQSVFLEIKPEIEDAIRRRVNYDPHLAQDLVHDVYLAWNNVTVKFSTRSDARGYLYRMAVNLAHDHRKVEARRAEILRTAAPLYELHSVDEGPEAEVFARAEVARIEEALKELPKHCRDILILSRVYGKTHGEIAAELGISKSLIEKYIVKALLHCRDRLGSL